MLRSQSYMKIALEEAQEAYKKDEVPVGAIIVKDQKIISTGHNLIRTLNDPTAHAEIIALKKAAQILSQEKLIDCDIYVTLEPCPMCAYAISLARVRRLYFGATDSKSGGVISGPQIFNSTSCHHKVDFYHGMLEKECSSIIKEFFYIKRIDPSSS